jgi:anti-sigma factor RsiW
MTGHLTPLILNALADGELTSQQLASTNEHLAGCSLCSSSALNLNLLKSLTAKAGKRYSPSPSFQKHIVRQISQDQLLRRVLRGHRSHEVTSGFRLYGWAAALALLVACLGIILAQRNASRSGNVLSAYSSLATEVCDQHIATLAANTPPQVISSDRHTVKPWFQGKLPFSFNLPENLPSDTTLDGANLTYIHNHPSAQLLYSIGKHRVSIYLEQKTATDQISGKFSLEHSGFQVVGFSTDEIDGIAVSDVDPARLSDLSTTIAKAQK